MMLILAEIVNFCRIPILPAFLDNTQAAGYSKTFVNFCQTARCHIPENSMHFCENMKAHKFVSVQHLLRNGPTVLFGLNSAIEGQLWRGCLEWSERTSAGTGVCSSATWSTNFLWQWTTPVIVGWVAGRAWKINNKWCTCLSKLLWNFYSM